MRWPPLGPTNHAVSSRGRPPKGTASCAGWPKPSSRQPNRESPAAGARPEPPQHPMTELLIREDLVRRLSAAVRAGELYAPTHPLVQRSIDTLAAVTTKNLQNQQSAVIGFLGNDIVVNDLRLGKFSAQLIGLVRDMHERQIEKISFQQGTNRDDLRTLVELMADRRSQVLLSERLLARGVKRITIGRISIADDDGEHTGIAMAKRVYDSAVETAETIWEQAKAGDQPDPNAARKIIE